MLKQYEELESIGGGNRRAKPDFSCLGLPADDGFFKNFNTETEKHIEDLKHGSNNILVKLGDFIYTEENNK